VRKWVWFIPIIPPNKALIDAAIRIKVGAVFCKIKDIIISGASFCHEARIIQVNQESEVITGGNQKWNGAIPSFNIIADKRRRFIYWVENIDHWERLAISIILDPSAWAIKYLMAASVSWFSLVFVIIGINLNILIYGYS